MKREKAVGKDKLGGGCFQMRRTLNTFVVGAWCISHLCSSSTLLKFVENQNDVKKQFYSETTINGVLLS